MNGFKFIRCEIMNKTMDELSNLLDVSKQSIYTWESGLKKIPIKRLEQLSEMTGIPKRFFTTEHLSAEDEVLIRNNHLKRSIKQTIDKYGFYVQGYEFEKPLKNITEEEYIHEVNMIKKRKNRLHQRVDDVIEIIIGETSNDIWKEIHHRIDILEKFLFIMWNNNNLDFLNDILRTTELIFDNQGNRKQVNDIDSTYPLDLLANENDFINDLYKVLYRYKENMMVEANQKTNPTMNG